MSYGKDIYAKAEVILRRKKQSAISKSDIRREKIFTEIPRAREIEQLISRSGISAAKAVLFGAKAQMTLRKLKEDNLKLQEELAFLLVSHGYSENDLDVKYDCKECNDTGYIDGRMCSCMKTILRDTAFKELNALSPLELSSFDTFNLNYYSTSPDKNGNIPRNRLEKFYKFCVSFAESFNGHGRSILMEGGTGLGKTHLSLAIAHRVIERGYGVIYCSTPNILRAMEQEYFSNSSSMITKSNAEKCDLLILDDLGTEFATSYTKSAVYNLINIRMMMNKPVIVSTNLSLNELNELYSDRFISRFVGEHYYLEFIGEDIRIKTRTEKLL